jgi:hypothetical protein
MVKVTTSRYIKKKHLYNCANDCYNGQSKCRKVRCHCRKGFAKSHGVKCFTGLAAAINLAPSFCVNGNITDKEAAPKKSET